MVGESTVGRVPEQAACQVDCPLSENIDSVGPREKRGPEPGSSNQDSSQLGSSKSVLCETKHLFVVPTFLLHLKVGLGSNWE